MTLHLGLLLSRLTYRLRQLAGSGALLIALTFIVSSEARAQLQFVNGLPFTEDVVLDMNFPAAAVAFAPDGRIFIAVKDGYVLVAENGAIRPEKFIDIASRVNRRTDRGLLGIALDPDFPTKPYVYLLYAYDPPEVAPDAAAPRLVRLTRVQADAAKNYNVAIPGTEEVILGRNSVAANIAPPYVPDQNPTNASCMTGLNMNGTPIEDCLPVDGMSHSAGTLIFAKDKSLYVSVGDGTDYNGPNQSGLRVQMLDSLAGKVIRIDPNTGLGLPGNPYYDTANPGANRSRVWAMGFRNPFRMTLDPSGEAYIADVGTSYWEEVNRGKGANFGWPCYEGGVAGTLPQGGGLEGNNTISRRNKAYETNSLTAPLCKAIYDQGESIVTSPTYAYQHTYGADKKDLGASISGVAFYSGTQYPGEYQGALFFGDYAKHTLRYLTFDALRKPTAHDFAIETADNGYGVVQLLTGPDDNVYAMMLSLTGSTGPKSQLRRIRYAGTESPPRVIAKADPSGGPVPLTVSFRSDGTTDFGGRPLSYSWEFGDGGTSTDPNPIHVYTTVGTFTATLTARQTTPPFLSGTQSVTIRTGVFPPKAFIDTPAAGTTYKIGDVITFSGHASFGNGSNEQAALSWVVLQHHNEHEHLVDEVSGASGSFAVEEHADSTSYEICILASSNEGLQDQKCQPIFPQKTDYTFASDPPGAPITYVDEGAEVLAPYVAQPIVGSHQSIVAPPIHAGRSFVKWSDGETSLQRDFVVGTTPVTFTAQYVTGAPEARITTNVDGGPKPLIVKFSAAESIDPEGEPLRYIWTFPGGVISEEANVTRVFDRAGSYLVTLRVEDKFGAGTTAEKTIVVEGTGAVGARPVRLAATLSGGKNCGNARRPCTFGASGSSTVSGKLPVAAAATGLEAYVVIERRVGSSWRAVSTLPAVQRRRAFSLRVRMRSLPRSGLYRLSLLTLDTSTGLASRSAYRYLVRR